jgi:hypothetical protein
MNILKPLSVPFEHHLHELFLERLTKSNNTKALKFVKQHDVIANGILCKQCDEIKPLYCYGQNKGRKFGIKLPKCIKCYTNLRCPYARLLSSAKGNSRRRSHPPPEITVDDLKEMFKQQNGICPVKGEKLKEKCHDGDPFNMSIERKNNSIHYTKDNVVLICQKYQIGGVYDYSVQEIGSWFKYDSSSDGFSFDPSIFNKPKTVRRKYRKGIRQGDDMKTCTDCNKLLPLTAFSGINSLCKSCHSIRSANYYNTPYGFMKKVVAAAATSSAKRRGSKRKRKDTSHDCDENIFQLFVDIIKEQGGRCAITGIPMVYKMNHQFAASPDRLDDSKGYVKGNVRFIITPLNTPRNK